MSLRSSCLAVMTLTSILVVGACAPKATPPPVDTISTLPHQLAYQMLTQTAAAASQTPMPATATLPPTATDAPTLEPTQSGPLKKPVIKIFTGCYYRPGPEYTLDSNISAGKKVDVVGVGSTPGWYVIINPYFHKQCWVEATSLEIDPAMDLSTLPVMTPIP